MVLEYVRFGATLVLSVVPFVLAARWMSRRESKREADLRAAVTRRGLSYAKADLFRDMRRPWDARLPEQSSGSSSQVDLSRYVQSAELSERAAGTPGAALQGLPSYDGAEILQHVIWGHLDGCMFRIFEQRIPRPGDDGDSYASFLLLDLHTQWPRATVSRGGRLRRMGVGGWVMPDDPIFTSKLSVSSETPEFALALLSEPMRQLLFRARKVYDQLEVSGRWLLIRQPGQLDDERIDVLMRLARDFRVHVPPHLWRAAERRVNA